MEINTFIEFGEILFSQEESDEFKKPLQGGGCGGSGGSGSGSGGCGGSGSGGSGGNDPAA